MFSSPRCRVLPLVLALTACGFDRADRWLKPPPEEQRDCELGAERCLLNKVERCSVTRDGVDWVEQRDCGEDLICVPELAACARCTPGERRCDGQVPEVCSADGEDWERMNECDGEAGFACRNGSCRDLCVAARLRRSNVGCEYWAADLDNAFISNDLNAAEQQFALVISNPQPDVTASVTVEQDDSAVGEPNEPIVLLEERVAPYSLQVFPLGPREVDGSPPGEYNTGSHTALTRAAYRVRSSVPVVAFQFNPLDNVNVFSNDASLLKPVEALIDDASGVADGYVVLGWPQTIAITDDPNTNFSSTDPNELRAFLTIVGTRLQTTVRITPSARILGSEDIPATDVGESLELQINPFDVINLETDDFNADFTGTLVGSDAPIVVFSGSEASDAPFFDELADRKCCADHLEEQLDHIRTAGQRFVAPVAFNRSLAVANAGGDIGVVAAPETFRVISASRRPVQVRTSLAGKDKEFELQTLGSYREIQTSRDFLLDSDGPVMLGNVSPSQLAAGVPSGFPGGDPSFLIIPPVEQYRADYVFLTPDSYAFDFLRIIAPPEATVILDDTRIEDIPSCTNGNPEGVTQTLSSADQKDFTVYRCQLSFPNIDPATDADQFLSDGVQNDGVHRIESDQPIGVLVDGFDRNVSYSYAAGTELMQIVPR